MRINPNERQSQLMFFFWLGFILVFTLNIFVWLYVDQVENKFREELESRLLSVGKLVNRLIDEPEISVIIPGERTSIEYLYYRQLLEDILYENNLQNIFILSPQMEIIISVPDLQVSKMNLNLNGSQYFSDAVKGNAAVSGIESFSGEKFMSSFTPIQNIDGFVTAILFIEAPANYFDVLVTLRTRILLFSLINFVLLILIAVFLLRIIRKAIHYQAQIKDHEHLVQLGTMAANVAHELRNPLNIIEGTNDIIKKKYSGTEDELFSYIPEEIKRLSGLIENFLQFARTPKLNPEEKSIDVLIERLMLSIDENEHKKISFHKPEKSLYFKTDFNILEQAILNLLLNALQATTKKGEVNIKFEKIQQNFLVCTVTDDGEGIQENHLKRIFEPFFTTKEKGTGLGLAITKRLIEGLGGNLSVQSKIGIGTIFTIKISELKAQP